MVIQMQTYLLDYYNTLQSLINRGDANEHSFRTALENLLNAFKPTQAVQSQSSKQGEIVIIHEPKSKQGQGNIRPDFKVVHKMPQDSKTQIPQEKVGYESLVGFIECKNYGVDLSPLVKSKQIEKYLSVCHNIILTDYNRFILLSYGKIIDDFTLFPNGVESNLLNATQDKATQKTKIIESTTRISQLLSEFFHTTAQITQKDELVKVLSTQSFYLSTAIFNEFSTQDLESNATNLLTATTQTSTTTDFHAAFDKSYQSFRDLESADISPIEFCDIVAQSIVYGAFVAHIESEIYEIDKIPTEMFVALLPKHFVTLREFIESSLPARNLPDSIAYALSNIIKTIALIDKPSLATSFQKEIGELSIYLYEDFLKAYDELRGEQKRKEGGVFYTPEPIVNMIVRSIDELLQTHFGKTFSDENVKVLDFATGTGSFLAKVFELILQNQSEVFAKNVIINKCFRDIYGFEMSFVPYIVAHLKLSSLLRAKGFSEFSAYQKFQVYLTNTLDLDTARQIHLQVPFDTLKNERDKSLQLKHKEDLLVILGNPPYNRKSKNKGVEILKYLQDYKPKNEQNIQPLDDDYIKFIRFAQWKLTEQNQKSGIMGFITNNSYLYGRTHRKMRESLAKTFDEIYILNLHGDNAEDKNDKNVFDIRVGVCISLFVKYENSHTDTPFCHTNATSCHTDASSCHTERSEVSKEKNQICHTEGEARSISNIQNRDFSLSVKAQYDKSTVIANERSECGNPKNNDKLAKIHYFSTKDNEILRRKDKFALLNDIAQNGLDSIEWQTLKLDSPYFWFVPKDLSNTEYENFWELTKSNKAIFKNHSSAITTGQDNICVQTNKNTIESALQDCIKLDDEQILQKYNIKNKDAWNIKWAKDCVKNNDGQIMQIAHRPFDSQWTYYHKTSNGFLNRPRYEVAKHFIEKENFGLMFQRGLNQGSVFVVDKMGEGNFLSGRTYIAPLYCYDSNLDKQSKSINFTQKFSDFIAKHKVLKSKSPKQILAFIYANLYNPAYRAKYLEYLKIGFPRVDFEVTQSKFDKLAELGQKLIDLHLMRIIPNDKTIELKFREGANKSNPNFTLEKPKYEPNQNKIILNADLEIVGVSAEVWDYTIGGYKVLDKWLKYRANDKNGAITLEQADFAHILNVAKILKATINLQKELANIK